MADGNRVPEQAGSLAPLIDLATLLGGTRSSTTSSANIAPLQQLLGTIQSRDPSAQLQAIFQQAAGQMPGLQARYANAVGARSGSNSAVQGQLNKLLQQTTLAGQNQLATQQLQSDATQANIANAIAQATRGTTTQAGPNLGRATQIIGLLTAGNKLYKSELGQQAVRKGGELLGSLGEYFSSSGNPITGGDYSVIGSGYDFGEGLTDFASSAGSFLDAIGNYDWGNFDFNFADGGAVNTRELRSGGGRRSAAPEYEFAAPQRMRAGQGVGVASQTGDTAVGPTSQAQSLAELADALSIAGQHAAPVALSMANPLGFFAHAINSTLGLPATSSQVGTAVNAAQGQLGVIGAILGLLGLIDKGDATDAGVATGSGFSSVDPATGAVSSVSTAPAPGSVAEALGLSNSAFGMTGPVAAAIAAENAAAQKGEESLGVVGSIGTAAAEGLGMSVGESLGAAAGGGAGIGESIGAGIGSAAGEGIGAGIGESIGSIGSDYARGGAVKGPGTGTSDSIKANLSDGEYVISADVVRALGQEFFDNLQAQYHTPVSAARK